MDIQPKPLLVSRCKSCGTHFYGSDQLTVVAKKNVHRKNLKHNNFTPIEKVVEG